MSDAIRFHVLLDPMTIFSTLVEMHPDNIPDTMMNTIPDFNRLVRISGFDLAPLSPGPIAVGTCLRITTVSYQKGDFMAELLTPKQQSQLDTEPWYKALDTAFEQAFDQLKFPRSTHVLLPLVYKLGGESLTANPPAALSDYLEAGRAAQIIVFNDEYLIWKNGAAADSIVLSGLEPMGTGSRKPRSVLAGSSASKGSKTSDTVNTKSVPGAGIKSSIYRIAAYPLGTNSTGTTLRSPANEAVSTDASHHTPGFGATGQATSPARTPASSTSLPTNTLPPGTSQPVTPGAQRKKRTTTLKKRLDRFLDDFEFSYDADEVKSMLLDIAYHGKTLQDLWNRFFAECPQWTVYPDNQDIPENLARLLEDYASEVLQNYDPASDPFGEMRTAAIDIYADYIAWMRRLDVRLRAPEDLPMEQFRELAGLISSVNDLMFLMNSPEKGGFSDIAASRDIPEKYYETIGYLRSAAAELQRTVESLALHKRRR